MKDAIAALFEQALDQLFKKTSFRQLIGGLCRSKILAIPRMGMATNVAMNLHKSAQMAPREMANYHR